MLVEWNVNKSAGWLEIGIHTVARMYSILYSQAVPAAVDGGYRKPSLPDKPEIAASKDLTGRYSTCGMRYVRLCNTVPHGVRAI